MEIDSTTTEAPAPVSSGPRVRPATMDHLRKKRARTKIVDIQTVDDDGEDLTLQFRLRAISSKAYDRLISEHPPTPKQKDTGATYNPDTFTPALIAACSSEPKLTVEDATELYLSDDWSGGEIGGLFFQCVRLCQGGLDVPFTERG